MSTSILLKSMWSPFFLTGLALALFIWVLDPVIDAMLLQHGSFYQQLTQPNAHQIYIRSTISLIFIVFGLITSIVLEYRRRSDEMLRDIEKRYRSLVEGSLAGIRLTRYKPGIPVDLPVTEQAKLIIQNAAIIECNDQYAKMYGYSQASELVNSSYTEFAETTPELLKTLETFVARGYSLEGVESCERMTDGTVKYFLNTARGAVENGKLIQTWGVANDITEHKQMENALRESENLYRSLVESSFQGIRWYKLDPGIPIDLPVKEQVQLICQNATIGECNEQYARMYGYDQAREMVGSPFVELKKITPELLEMIELFITNDYILKASESCEILPDGTVKYFLNTEVGTIENGKLVKTWGVVNDITERKQASTMLERREAQLIESQKLAKLGSWEMEIVSQQLEWSEESYRLFDKDPDSYMPTIDGFISMVHPDDIETWQIAYNEAMANADKPFNVTIRMINDSDREWVMSSMGKIRRDEENNIIGAGGTMQDVTEYRQMERLLRQVSEGVMGETGEEYLQSLVQHIANSFNVDYAFIGLLDGEGRTCIKTIAVSARGEITDNFSYDLEGTPCKNIVNEGACVHPNNVQAEFPEDTLLKEMGVQSYAAAPLRNPGGETIGLLVMMDSHKMEKTETILGLLQLFAIRTVAELDRLDATRRIDIAHQKLLEQKRGETAQVQKELDKVKEKLVKQTQLAAVGQVAASIAHELRNPLGAVRNAAYYMNRHLISDNPKIARYLDIIDQEIEVSDQIISNLLEMTRARKPTKHEVDLGTVLREVIKRANLTNDIQCHLQLEQEPFMVEADPAQLRQVLDNLLVNALQSIKGEGDIFIRGRHGDGMDIITIQDTGTGINAEQRARLFEPLFTTRAKGTGLGLTISRQIIEQHEGTLDYVKQDGSGAQFEIKLPHAI